MDLVKMRAQSWLILENHPCINGMASNLTSNNTIVFLAKFGIGTC